MRKKKISVYNKNKKKTYRSYGKFSVCSRFRGSNNNNPYRSYEKKKFNAWSYTEKECSQIRRLRRNYGIWI